jgi:xanthine/uracil permease
MPSILTGLATLVTIIICAVWLKGSYRFFAMLIGCAVGYGVAAAFGMLDQFSSVSSDASSLVSGNRRQILRYSTDKERYFVLLRVSPT